MIVLFRITRTKYAKDLSGVGARLSGARWNYKGTPIVYTAQSRSLAALEALVHMSQSDFLSKRKLVTIEIPKTITTETITVSDLPSNWRTHPPPFKLADIGTKWAVEKESLLLRVPSAVVDGEFNVLINPLHPDIGAVKVAKIEDFVFDSRLQPR